MLRDQVIPDWQWFTGLDHEPTPIEARELAEKYDRVVNVDGGVALLKYERPAAVAIMHGFVEPGRRGTRVVADLVDWACAVASADGMQKIVVPIADGNPFLRLGRKSRFGFALEGILRRQVMIGGKLRDLHVYGRLLQHDPTITEQFRRS